MATMKHFVLPRALATLNRIFKELQPLDRTPKSVQRQTTIRLTPKVNGVIGKLETRRISANKERKKYRSL